MDDLGGYSKALEHKLTSLASDVTEAAIHYRMFLDLWASRGEFEREFAESRAFWSLTLSAHLNAALLSVARAYDQHPKAVSIRNLLADLHAEVVCRIESLVGSGAEVDRDLRNGVEDLECDMRLATDQDPLVKRLVGYRGARLAHRSAGLVSKGEAGKALCGLEHEEIRQLIDRATSILNRTGQAHWRRTWISKIVGGDDYRIVLEAVRLRIEMQEAAIAEEERLLDQGESG
jgi:hypothetical protein